jgi:hypothetical protein
VNLIFAGIIWNEKIGTISEPFSLSHIFVQGIPEFSMIGVNLRKIIVVIHPGSPFSLIPVFQSPWSSAIAHDGFLNFMKTSGGTASRNVPISTDPT